MRSAIALGLVLLLAGCTDFEAEAGPTNRIGLVGIDVAAPEVSTGRVVLAVIATLDNLNAKSGELNVTVKAFDLTTNMLTETAHVPVGVLEKDRSKQVEARLALPRAAGYRLEVLVEQSDRIVQRGEVQVSNLMALEPTLYDTGLRISQIDVQILDTEGGRVSIRCLIYLTNEGGSASRPLRLQAKAREVSTGILADERWLDVGSIPMDATRIETTVLALPDEFNYEIEAFLWDGDVIVERGAGRVQFLPTFTQPRDSDLVITDPDISLFREPSQSDTRSPYFGDSSGSDSPSHGSPGPAFWLVALALLGAAMFLRRSK